MEDAIKVLSAKFDLSYDSLNDIGKGSEDISAWLVTLGAYILDNDKKYEDQKASENNLRKQRLNAEHQLSQLEKQLISCNSKLAKYEKQILEVNVKLEKTEEDARESQKKFQDVANENKVISAENETLKQKYSYLENEKFDFAELIEKKNQEVDRLNEEWNDMSKKLAEANRIRYELQYKMDEITNSEARKEFKEKRLAEEKTLLSRRMEELTSELRVKTDLVNNVQKDTTSKLLEVESKYENLQQEALQLKNNLETSRKTCTEQEKKIQHLMSKIKQQSEEHVELENNIQQELSAQTKLVQLYKDDRDHAKGRLEEVTSAISELQTLVKETTDENVKLEAKLSNLDQEKSKEIEDLGKKIKEMNNELENANDLLQISRKKGDIAYGDKDISMLSPMAAASSALLKKGMTLTQIYTEYVKISEELLIERDENSRLKMYMEQILQEVEEKAPMLIRQKQDFEHSKNTITNMSMKLEENIKECHRLQNEHAEYDRKLGFHKREEKRLKALCVDLSQQVRILLKEVEEARGGVVSSSTQLPELDVTTDDLSVSSSGQVISEHLVTFKSIEELQEQNQRLLATVRQLSEDQEKLEQEGGHEVIQDLRKKIENAKTDLDSMKEHQKTQEDLMQQLSRQRDMYKVLCQSSGVMVGDISSTTAPAAGSQSMVEVETELTKVKVELDNTLNDHKKFKDEVENKQKTLNDTIIKREEDISSLKLEKERIKNQLEFAEEKHSILTTTNEGFKKEIAALESKCKSITEALNKTRAESEQYKQDYGMTKEKLVGLEVSVKALETEKNLVKQAEKRLMEENQSLLEQQRSQNVLLTNLQTIQNNLERQEFETRKTLGKQVEGLQREMKALRRQNDNEGVQLKISAASLEKECKELKVKLGVEMEKSKQLTIDIEKLKEEKDQFSSKCDELDALCKATDKRLETILKGESNAKVKEDFEHELERYRVKIREMELTVSNAVTEKKAADDQIEVMKKHIEQFKEIGDSNEQAINTLTKTKESQTAEYEKKLSEANASIQSFKKQLAGTLAIKNQIRSSADKAEREYQAQITELKQANAPMERRLQEVTKALVQAKEQESSAVKESQVQINIAKEAQDKYERELVLHAKDVELLTALKEEVKTMKTRSTKLSEQQSEMKQTLLSNEKLIKQMKEHHKQEIKEGEIARKNLMDQNGLLHGQVEKLSAQLAAAKSLNRTDDDKEASNDKSLEDVYELLRFVRREKEIAETKAEASETESMRYRQRAEHLQRDLDETKAALELELQRTQGKMLTDEEHKEMLEKLKKLKEYEILNAELQKQKHFFEEKNRNLSEKLKKAENDGRVLGESKKSLEVEKNAWLAEKTALKGEIERWTNRTNQLVAQTAKSDNEEIKKLETVKAQNHKTIVALQEDVKRIKQQFDLVKRESLKLKTEKTENQNKIASLQAELAQASINRPSAVAASANTDQINTLQKELEEAKKSVSESAEKNKMLTQLKKVAKKYKTQSEKLQKILQEHKITIDSNFNVTSSGGQPVVITVPSEGATASTAQGATTEDKKVIENQLKEKTKLCQTLNDKISEIQGQLEAEKISSKETETKLTDVQKYYTESEKRKLELSKETENLKKGNDDLSKVVENLKKECADGKKKLEEQQEKNKKVLKTAKDKIQSLTKNKDSSNREAEQLKKTIEELKGQLKSRSTAAVEQSKSLLAEKAGFEDEISKLQNKITELTNENAILNEKIEDLVARNTRLQDEKRQAEKFIKAASQKKSRVQVVAHATNMKSITQQDFTESTGTSPLTATVRPHATPSQSTQKFHPQSTPTASIRPLAHAAPLAMISPSVPVTLSQISTNAAPIAPIAALPVSAQVQPQVIDISGRSNTLRSSMSDRGSAFKAPIARVTVQAQERGESSGSMLPSVEEHSLSDLSRPSTSAGESSQIASGTKRSHIEVEQEQEDDDLLLEEVEVEPDEPGNKRQRVDVIEDHQLERDSQEYAQAGALEEDDDLLVDEGNEEIDEEVATSSMQGQTVVPNQEPRVVVRDITQQQAIQGQQRASQPSPQDVIRQRTRARSHQLAFSLTQGQGASGYYEDVDDSTVPSTPTLFMPKRNDGFAEAVSSPVVRYPTFSFSSNEQQQVSSHPSSLDEHGDNVDTRLELAADDQANVPMTPLGVVPSENIGESTTTQFFPSEDNGQEQNVPQQIDLTEDDDEDEENAGDLPDIDTDADGNDAIEIFAPGELDHVDEADVDSEDSDSSDTSSDDSEDDLTEEKVIGENIDEKENEPSHTEEAIEDNAAETVTEIDAVEQDEKEALGGDTPDILEEISSQEPQTSTSTSVTQDSDIMIPTEEPKSEQDSPMKSEEPDKRKRVRLQRSTRGIRPRIRRQGASTRKLDADKTS